MMEKVTTNNAFLKVKRNKNIRFGRVGLYVTLILYTLFLMIPFYTIIISAFVDHAELDSALKFIWWPKTFSLQGFKNLVEYDVMYYETGIPSMLIGFFNTLWITCLPTTVGVWACSVYLRKNKIAGQKLYLCNRNGYYDDSTWLNASRFSFVL